MFAFVVLFALYTLMTAQGYKLFSPIRLSTVQLFFNLEFFLADRLAELGGLGAVFASEVRIRRAVVLERHYRARRVPLVAEREIALRRVQLRLRVLEIEERGVSVRGDRLLVVLLGLLNRAEREPVLRAQMVEEDKELEELLRFLELACRVIAEAEGVDRLELVVGDASHFPESRSVGKRLGGCSNLLFGYLVHVISFCFYWFYSDSMFKS